MRRRSLNSALLAVSAAALLATAASSAGAARHQAAACPLRVKAVFWTSTDWELLGQELKGQLSPCADY